MTSPKIPVTMTEVVITSPGGPEVLQPRSAPTPVPGDGELLVRVRAAGVNRPDVLQRKGLYPMPPGAAPTSRQWGQQSPASRSAILSSA